LEPISKTKKAALCATEKERYGEPGAVGQRLFQTRKTEGFGRKYLTNKRKYKMKIYSVFFVERDGRLVRPLGDRSVLQIDGRLSKTAQQGIAEDWARKHGFLAYAIRKGASLREVNLEEQGDETLLGEVKDVRRT
jgi:hypothetical protein